jgi:hypothetical protein
MAARTKNDEVYPAEEAQRRFEALVKAALNTPPSPMKDRPRKLRESKSGRKAAKPSS